MNKIRKEVRGLTLIELVVVLAILGVLAATLSRLVYSQLREDATQRVEIDRLVEMGIEARGRCSPDILRPSEAGEGDGGNGGGFRLGSQRIWTTGFRPKFSCHLWLQHRPFFVS